MLHSIDKLLARIDPATATIDGVPPAERRLSNLDGVFFDDAAYREALEAGDELVYTVASFEPDNEEGGLHLGVGMLLPGRIGGEYFMTKGHVHSWLAAAEFYIGLRGAGVMLLEDWPEGESRMVPLEANGIVYVPGGVAHRTINTGAEPLVYLGVYPARAGHDYSSIAATNFRMVVTEIAGEPVMVPRAEHVA